ncbi:adenosine deaminase [Oscillibacter sp. PC13]|uniref:adenosine deaminase n=1 Tax=Oscillibacter sp. PC13 TaxID=1855299 RepID=UPI0008E0B443|nr:adenosine deaminase [Oscillibacter sp. PC13]SFQ10284.1 adenosine deaminase [Oscillibacter sp. PC13]
MDASPSIIAQMPKLELHVHLESTMDGEQLARYASKQGKQLPRPGNAIYECSAEDLSNFLAFLDMICSMVGSIEDLREVARDFSLRSRQEHILYAEPILNPTHWPQFTVPQLICALEAGFDEGAAEGGTDCRFTLSLSRNQSQAEALDFVNLLCAHRSSRLIGLSIDGNEALTGRTGEKFSPAFRRAKEVGLSITVHAGESSGPEGVRDALDLLFACRLDHGVRAAEDADLTARLVRERIPLNLCLTSNLTLLYRNPEEHPLRRLWDAGAVITLNRDDPTFLGLTLTEELTRCARFAHLTIQDLLQAQYWAVDAAFCSDAEKQQLRSSLHAFAQSLNR